MPYENEICQLAKGALAVHGRLLEVVFLKGNKDSLLVFADKTVIPVLHRNYGYDLRKEAYAMKLANEHSGTDYFSLLAFGYTGTGSACYSNFLSTAGFQRTNVGNISAPMKLKPNGTEVKGSYRDDDSIEWQDGSVTPKAFPLPNPKPETPELNNKSKLVSKPSDNPWWKFWL